jgi:hypothetical protein
MLYLSGAKYNTPVVKKAILMPDFHYYYKPLGLCCFSSASQSYGNLKVEEFFTKVPNSYPEIEENASFLSTMKPAECDPPSQFSLTPCSESNRLE